MQTFDVATRSRTQLIDITGAVQAAVSCAGVADGICVVFCPHTTAAITIQENADPDVAADVISTLDGLVPRDGDYRHVEGNSDAHVKSTLVGASETLIIEQGRLVLGTWQAIYFCEFDGPRSRRLHIKVISG